MPFLALPGDTVELRNKALLINGQISEYAHAQAAIEALGERGETMARRDFGPVQVPEGHYFFLGDNRDNRADARFIGMVPRFERLGARIQ